HSRASTRHIDGKRRTWSHCRRRSPKFSSTEERPGSSRCPEARRRRFGLRPERAGRREKTIKYAHRIVTEVSETRALHHWHPVLLAEMDVHPRRARASKGKG